MLHEINRLRLFTVVDFSCRMRASSAARYLPKKGYLVVCGRSFFVRPVCNFPDIKDECVFDVSFKASECLVIRYDNTFNEAFRWKIGCIEDETMGINKICCCRNCVGSIGKSSGWDYRKP